MKKIAFFIWAGFIPILLTAQKITISGKITDFASGETMISANAYDENTLTGTVTNNYGFYALRVNKGKVKLVSTYIGYNPFSLEFYAQKDTIINIELDPNLTIEEVVVTDKGPQQTVESSQMSQIELKVADLKSAPALLGEIDVMKTLQQMPGVQGGSEGSSGFFVRGGAPDQNLILLDGVPVYNVNHLFGFFSVFNADAIKNVTLIKGGFPARYGGRLSSVVDIRMKEGNIKEWHGEGSIGILSSKITVEGPIKKNTSSLLISGRRMYYDLLTYPFQAIYNKKSNVGSEEVWFGLYFYDLNVKYNHILSNKDRIYVSAYMGKDKFHLKIHEKPNPNPYNNINSSYNTKLGLGWGNITSAFRWNHIYSGRLFSNLTVTFSDYTFKTNIDDEYEYRDNDIVNIDGIELSYYSRIRDYALKYEFDFPVNDKNYLRFGASNTVHKFSPGVAALKSFSNSEENSYDTTAGTKNIPANEFSAYLEDDIAITSKLKANIGVHFSAFSPKGKTYTSIEPRLSARYMVTNSLSVKGSYVTMTQYINLMANTTVGLPTDLWIPSSKFLLPQKAWQSALGMAYNLNDKYEFTLEAYYKEMENLVEFSEGQGFLNIGLSDVEHIATQGVGNSKGLELMINKSSGKFRGWISYTLSNSDRKFEEISNGKRFPFAYDRRHVIAIVGTYDINPKINVGASWTYYTGRAFTFPEEKSFSGGYVEKLQNDKTDPDNSTNNYYTDYEPTDAYFETRNNYRMPDYHRLDIGINFTKQKKRAERTWSFGAYNAYFRQNAFTIYKTTEFNPTTEESVPVLKQISILPFVPYFRYSLKF